MVKTGEEKQTIDALTSDPVYVMHDQRLFTSDTSMEEEFEFIGTGSESDGLICRYSAEGWYEMSIGNNGHWKISLATTEGSTVQRTVLAEGDTTPIAGGVTQFGATCIGNKLSVALDGKELGSAEDATLPVGDIFGLIHQEEEPFTMHSEISKIHIVDGNGKELINLDKGLWSFYFSAPFWAVSISEPKDVRSLMSGYTSIQPMDGQAEISTAIQGWIVLINPQKMPRDVEINVDVVGDAHTVLDGVGVMCNWSDDKGGYVFWYKGPYTIITPFDIDEHGIPTYMGGDSEFVTTQWKDITEGRNHHIEAKCGVGMVQFYIDGHLVVSHAASEFKDPDKNKTGTMVGLVFSVEDSTGGTYLVDDYSVSWGLPTPTPIPTPTP